MATPKTSYRLREIPHHLDKLGLVELLSLPTVLDVARADIHISSLSSARHADRPDSKTCTLTFGKLPARVAPDKEKPKAEWSFPVPGLERALLLDTHFLGVTELNDVSDAQHEVEYALSKILISPLQADYLAVLSLFLVWPVILLGRGNLRETTKPSCGSETRSLATYGVPEYSCMAMTQLSLRAIRSNQ